MKMKSMRIKKTEDETISNDISSGDDFVLSSDGNISDDASSLNAKDNFKDHMDDDETIHDFNDNDVNMEDETEIMKSSDHEEMQTDSKKLTKLQRKMEKRMKELARKKNVYVFKKPDLTRDEAVSEATELNKIFHTYEEQRVLRVFETIDVLRGMNLLSDVMVYEQKGNESFLTYRTPARATKGFEKLTKEDKIVKRIVNEHKVVLPQKLLVKNICRSVPIATLRKKISNFKSVKFLKLQCDLESTNCRKAVITFESYKHARNAYYILRKETFSQIPLFVMFYENPLQQQKITRNDPGSLLEKRINRIYKDEKRMQDLAEQNLTRREKAIMRNSAISRVLKAIQAIGIAEETEANIAIDTVEDIKVIHEQDGTGTAVKAIEKLGLFTNEEQSLDASAAIKAIARMGIYSEPKTFEKLNSEDVSGKTMSDSDTTAEPCQSNLQSKLVEIFPDYRNIKNEIELTKQINMICNKLCFEWILTELRKERIQNKNASLRFSMDLCADELLTPQEIEEKHAAERRHQEIEKNRLSKENKMRIFREKNKKNILEGKSIAPVTKNQLKRMSRYQAKHRRLKRLTIKKMQGGRIEEARPLVSATDKPLETEKSIKKIKRGKRSTKKLLKSSVLEGKKLIKRLPKEGKSAEKIRRSVKDSKSSSTAVSGQMKNVVQHNKSSAVLKGKSEVNIGRPVGKQSRHVPGIKRGKGREKLSATSSLKRKRTVESSGTKMCNEGILSVPDKNLMGRMKRKFDGLADDSKRAKRGSSKNKIWGIDSLQG